jgi:hypothetical protein
MSVSQIWKCYSLSIILSVLFLVTWALHTYTGWVEFQNEQQSHNEVPQWFGDSGYIWQWARATMENWQSEFLQLFTFVVLTSMFSHHGSPESKDSDETTHQSLKRIEESLQQLKAGLRK